MSEIIKVKALLKLKSTEDGGRKKGIASRYRPNHVFEYNEDGSFPNTYMGQIMFDDEEWIMPNEEREVEVVFLKSGGLEKFLIKGRSWWIHEGVKQIGVATILEVCGG